MTPKEFRDALKQLGLSQRQFAKDIETDVTTINRWATGKADISGAAKAYVRLLLQRKAYFESK